MLPVGSCSLDMSRRFVLAGVAIVLAGPLTIVLLLDPSSQAACSAVTGSGPSSVPGIPQQYLPYFTGAGSYFQLGSTGWAYLAALNYYAESSFGTRQWAGHRRAVRRQRCGRCWPDADRHRRRRDRQLGYRRRADPGESRRRRRASERLQRGRRGTGAAALLRSIGAPGDWQAALRHWNDYQPEIDEVNQLVAQYTSTAVSSPTSSAGAVDQSRCPTSPVWAGRASASQS